MRARDRVGARRTCRRHLRMRIPATAGSRSRSRPSTPCPAGAQEVTTAPVAASAELRPGGQPAPRSAARARRHAARLDDGGDRRARPARRRRRPEHEPVRLPRTRARASSRVSTSTSPARSRAASSATRTASICGWSTRPTGDRRCSQGRSTWWSAPTRSPATARRTSPSPRRTTYANQRILALKGSGIDSAAALSGKRVCAVTGTTSLTALFALDPRPTLFGVSSWTDCLVMLQQGQVDAISTDDAVLSGLAGAGSERPGGGRRQHRRRALRRRASRRRTRTWFDSSTGSSTRCARTARGSGSTRPGCNRPRAVARPADGAVPGLIMTMLTTEEIDRELRARTEEVARDVGDAARAGRPSRAPSTCAAIRRRATAQRWARGRDSHSTGLWQDVGRMTSILDSAQGAAGTHDPSSTTTTARELTRWLRDRPLEVSRERIPLGAAGDHRPR